MSRAEASPVLKYDVPQIQFEHSLSYQVDPIQFESQGSARLQSQMEPSHWVTLSFGRFRNEDYPMQDYQPFRGGRTIYKTPGEAKVKAVSYRLTRNNQRIDLRDLGSLSSGFTEETIVEVLEELGGYTSSIKLDDAENQVLRSKPRYEKQLVNMANAEAIKGLITPEEEAAKEKADLEAQASVEVEFKQDHLDPEEGEEEDELPDPEPDPFKRLKKSGEFLQPGQTRLPLHHTHRKPLDRLERRSRRG